jgi:hypothetical protein
MIRSAGKITNRDFWKGELTATGLQAFSCRCVFALALLPPQTVSTFNARDVSADFPRRPVITVTDPDSSLIAHRKQAR